MSLSDLQTAIGWAANEGWNPGTDDAEAFHDVDPDGFLMGWLDARPITAISVVRHSAEFGFLGFYLCDPTYRGKGYGWRTWETGIAHLGTRTIGLDGVPAQQQNYETSGFTFVHQTQRFAGHVTGRAHKGHSLATPDDLAELIALDRTINKVDRGKYLANWFAPAPTRHTLVHRVGGRIAAAGTIRACQQAHKIGPLFAPNRQMAEHMLEALVDLAGATEINIDMPDPNTAAAGIARDLGLESAFSCARMYRGAVIERDLNRVFGEVTFELG